MWACVWSGRVYQNEYRTHIKLRKANNLYKCTLTFKVSVNDVVVMEIGYT